jgi:hypothetical protein
LGWVVQTFITVFFDIIFWEECKYSSMGSVGVVVLDIACRMSMDFCVHCAPSVSFNILLAGKHFQKRRCMTWTICCLVPPFTSPNSVNFLALCERSISRISIQISSYMFLVFFFHWYSWQCWVAGSQHAWLQSWWLSTSYVVGNAC